MNSFKDLIYNKKVALVGPALYMKDSNFGSEIDDNHDTVVRINRGIESISKYGSDIGEKTDIYYTCLIERYQQTGKIVPSDLKKKYGIKYVVAPPDSNIKGIANQTKFHSLVRSDLVKEILDILPIRLVDHVFHTELAKKIDCKPNTGFLSIFDILQFSPKILSIYGFSFYLDGFIPGQKSGVEKEKNCSEQEFANMAFNSKRHVQKNMWEYSKKTLLNNEKVKLDYFLHKILNLDSFSKEDFRKINFK